METGKKDILIEQVNKLEGIIRVLEKNFDCENEIPDEISFLNIVKENLAEMID